MGEHRHPKRRKAVFHSGSCSCNLNKSWEAADKITQMRNVCSSICCLIVALIIPFRLHQLTDMHGRQQRLFFFGSNCYLILKTSSLDCIVIVILCNSSGRSAEWRQQQPSRMSVSVAYTAIWSPNIRSSRAKTSHWNNNLPHGGDWKRNEEKKYARKWGKWPRLLIVLLMYALKRRK